MIKASDLNKYFNQNSYNQIHVVNNINLDFPNQGLVVILGPSGSGKTTLLNIISGLDKQTSGKVFFDNQNISKKRTKVFDDLRINQIGFIFQNYYLLNDLTVFENVETSLKLIGVNNQKEIDVKVDYILKQLAIDKYKNKKTSFLSGGQKQRVAIARALVKNPSVIIADEPTGNLDKKNTREVMNIIKSISKSKLVILVTHEKALATLYADRIIKIKDGRVVADYLNDEKIIKDYLLDNTIYLKSLNNQCQHSNSILDVKFFADKIIDKPLDLKIIFINDTLYFDVSDNYRQVKLVKDIKSMTIKDEKYQIPKENELLNTTFDQNILSITNSDKKKKNIFNPLKSNLFSLLKSLINTSFKNKIIYFIFASIGAIFAILISSIYGQVTLDYHHLLPINQNYLEVGSSSYLSDSIITFEQFAQMTINFQDFEYIPYDNNMSHDFLINIKGSKDTYFTPAKLEFSSHIKNTQIIEGRLPISSNEIVISKKYLELNSYNHLGVWEFSDLIGLSLRNGLNPSIEYLIVGVVDTNLANIYIYSQAQIFELLGMSQGHLMSEFNANQLKLQMLYDQLTNKRLSYLYHQEIDDFSLLLDQIGFQTKSLYHQALSQNQLLIKQSIKDNIIINLVLLIFSFLGFYFVMRSSLMQKIYQIAVFRLLGINKKEIRNSFIIEIMFITTISSFLGYSLMTWFLDFFSKGTNNSFFEFNINIVSYLIGLILLYIINLLAGLLPINILLRKTPAEIISKFDI